MLFRTYVPIKDCSEVNFRPFDNLTVLITLFKGVHHKRFMLNTAIHMSREPALMNHRKMSFKMRTLNRTQSTAS